VAPPPPHLCWDLGCRETHIPSACDASLAGDRGRQLLPVSMTPSQERLTFLSLSEIVCSPDAFCCVLCQVSQAWEETSLLSSRCGKARESVLMGYPGQNGACGSPSHLEESVMATTETKQGKKPSGQRPQMLGIQPQVFQRGSVLPSAQAWVSHACGVVLRTGHQVQCLEGVVCGRAGAGPALLTSVGGGLEKQLCSFSRKASFPNHCSL
jgi:hypothetical protein